MNKVDIPIADAHGAAAIGRLCLKYDMPIKAVKIKGLLHIRVWYKDPLDIFWLGCNYVAKSSGVFKTPLTT